MVVPMPVRLSVAVNGVTSVNENPVILFALSVPVSTYVHSPVSAKDQFVKDV